MGCLNISRLYSLFGELFRICHLSEVCVLPVLGSPLGTFLSVRCLTKLTLRGVTVDANLVISGGPNPSVRRASLN